MLIINKMQKNQKIKWSEFPYSIRGFKQTGVGGGHQGVLACCLIIVL
jgi:hypothetical protein